MVTKLVWNEALSKKFDFSDGRIKEPNGGKGANCVYAFSKNNRWFDFRCARSRVYSICELPVIGIENAQDSAEDV